MPTSHNKPITIDQLQVKTYSLFLLNLVISLVDTVEIFKVQLHQPVNFLVVILNKFIDQSLSLNAFAVLHQRSNDRNYVLCTLQQANTTDYVVYTSRYTQKSRLSFKLCWTVLCITNSPGTCKASRFDSNQRRRSDSKVMGRFKNFQISRACPLLIIAKRLIQLTVLSGTVYRLASSISDHTPVLFNVFEDWNEESVVPHISFVLFVINY